MPSDTPREVEEIQLEILKRMTPERRMELTFSFSNSIIRVSRKAFEERYPDPGKARVEWARAHYGDDIALKLERHYYKQLVEHGGG